MSESSTTPTSKVGSRSDLKRPRSRGHERTAPTTPPASMPARIAAQATQRPPDAGLRLDGRRGGVVVGLVDASTLLVAGVAGALLWPPASAPMFLMYACTTLAFLGKGAHRPRPLMSIALDDLRSVVNCTAVGAMAALALTRIAELGGAHYPFLRLWALYMVAAGLGRLALTQYEHFRRNRQSGLRPVVIMGAGHVGARVYERLTEHPEYGLRPIGFVEDSANPSVMLSGVLPRLGQPEDLAEVAARSGAECVVVAFPGTSDRRLLEPIRRCEEQGIEVAVVPRMYESLSDRVMLEHLGELPLLRRVRPDPRGLEFALKHALDRVLAALLLLLLLPLVLGLVAAVWLSSAGGILFRQRRIGRDGREFDLLKFRSMRPSPTEKFAPRPGSAPGGVEGEDRRTAVGRFLRRTSLDELPQLLNVLRGDMSLVGPRPERPEYVEQFAQTLHRYSDRHRVKSGMTGWAQVHGLRGQTSIAKRVEWDNYYIENWSLWLDFKVLVLTVFAVLARVE